MIFQNFIWMNFYVMHNFFVVIKINQIIQLLKTIFNGRFQNIFPGLHDECSFRLIFFAYSGIHIIINFGVRKLEVKMAKCRIIMFQKCWLIGLQHKLVMKKNFQDLENGNGLNITGIDTEMGYHDVDKS